MKVLNQALLGTVTIVMNELPLFLQHSTFESSEGGAEIFHNSLRDTLGLQPNFFWGAFDLILSLINLL